MKPSDFLTIAVIGLLAYFVLCGCAPTIDHADTMRTEIYNSGFNVHLDSIDYYFPEGTRGK